MTLINTELNKKVESAQVALNSSENNVETLNETIAIVEESKIQETVTLNADESDEILKTLENETQVEIDYEQYVIESYEKELKETKDEFQIQDDKDGAINEIWNGVKEIFNFGVSKSDVKSAIEKQEITLEKLKQAKIDGNFSEVYEEITGQKYDEQKIIQCHQIETELDKILNSDNPQDFEEEYLILSNQYKEMSNEYLSTSNELTNVLNNYADSQNNFIDKTAQVAQIGGMGMMIVGGVACFIPGGQVIGAGMMKFGQMLALGGTFGDNALEAVDLMTNDKGFKEESDEFKELGKETLVDGALFVAGYASGTIAGKAGEAVLNNKKVVQVAGETGAKILSQVTDKGLDVAMSLASDTAITGEVDLAGEGMSQFLGVLTGSATARTYGAKINTKLDKFIDDKLKLGIGKTEVEIPKVKNEEVETPKAKDIETERIKDVNSDTNKRTIDDSAWVVQRLDDNTCACASLINAIVSKPELYYELNDRIFLQEDGTYNVVLGGEVLPYHSDSDLPESTAKIVYGAWVEKYGEDYDGDFVTRIFSTLFDGYACNEIKLKPTTENLAELKFYNEGQHTALTANKNGHAYTFGGIGEDGTMILRDPQNPDCQLEIKPEDFDGWQVVGGSYTKLTRLDGSIENKVGATWQAGRDALYAKSGASYDDIDEFVINLDEIGQRTKEEFLQRYATQSDRFNTFCAQNGINDFDAFLIEFYDNPSIVQQAIEAMKVPQQAMVYPIRKCDTQADYNTLKSHIEVPRLEQDNHGNYSINGGHLIDAYGTPDSNGVYSITLSGQRFELEPTSETGIYKEYHINDGRQYRGLKSLATKEDIDNLLVKVKHDYAGDDFRPNREGKFKYKGRYWRMFETVSLYPISYREATAGNSGGVIPEIFD